MALPPGRFGSIRKIYGHGLLKTSLENRSKICPDSSTYACTVQDVSGQLKLCPDSPKYVRRGWNFVQTAQNMPLQPKMCPDRLKFLSRQLKICPDSPKCVQTLQDVSGQFKICPDSSTCVRTVQNMVGRERWLRTFLVCRERDLRVFRPEDFWVPPGRYKVFRPLLYTVYQYIVESKFQN